MNALHADNRRILIVDDNVAIHDDFQKIFCSNETYRSDLDEDESKLFGATPRPKAICDFELDSADQGEQGLGLVQQAVAQGRPYAVVFLDVRMPPGWDGIETARRIFDADREIQIVLCTAFSDYSTAEMVDRIGNPERLLILRKPFEVEEASLLAIALTQKWRLTRETGQLIRTQEELLADSGRVMEIIQSCQEELTEAHAELTNQATELSRRVRQRTAEILGTRQVAVFALATLAEARDLETGEHLERMREYSQIIAEQLVAEGPYMDEINETFLTNFYLATPLHDIGKVGIPDAVLLKPGRLTADEFELMKRHTLIGAEALDHAIRLSPCGDFLNMAAQIARSHHEKFNGSGYPAGLKGMEIPLSARIVAVADVFDALTSKRVYKDAIDPGASKLMIEQESGKHFDPAIVAAFQACYDELLEAKKKINLSQRETTPTRASIFGLDMTSLEALSNS